MTLTLGARAPFDGRRVLDWLGARAVPGLEEVGGGTYRRSLRLPSGLGTVQVVPGDTCVQAAFRLATADDLPMAVHHCGRLFDLAADPMSYAPLLTNDPALASLVESNPGLRVPGTVDGWETAVRAVLGQQISLPAARTITSRLVAAFGTPLPAPAGSVTHAFPTAEMLVDADLRGVAIPERRRETLRALARATLDGTITLDSGADPCETQRLLLEIPGVGDWTASYIAMRALGDPDAFPGSDLGIRRGAQLLGMGDDHRALMARAESWRPWRAYAAQYLWLAAV